MNCIHCGSTDTNKRGRTAKGTPRTYCKSCKEWSSGKGAPRILLLDIETTHQEYKLFRPGQQYVRPEWLIKPSIMICWSAKYLFQGKMFHQKLNKGDLLLWSDERLTQGIHSLMSNSDIIITQNGDEFDIKELNYKFLQYGLPPNNGYLSVDTLKKARQIFRSRSHKLGIMGEDFGFGGKDDLTVQDWYDAEDGKMSAVRKLSTYCDRDVLLLEDVYLKLRPWMKTHPNLAPYVELYRDLEEDEYNCPRCLNPVHEIRFCDRYFSAKGKQYESGTCGHCGSILRRKVTK